MKKTLAKNAALGLLAATMIFGFAGCSKNKASQQKARTIIVGTGTAYNPYCYLDEEGKLVGYEKDVLDEIDRLLPQYQFKYETFDFSNILLALSAGKIDIGAHQYEENEERRKNYLFSSETYNSFITHIVILKSRTDINSFEDLIGKTVHINVGDNSATSILKYNENAPADKQIKTFLTKSLQTEPLIAGLKGGQFDATFMPLLDMDKDNRNYGNILKAVGEPLNSSFSYFLFRKGDTELQEAIDGALRQLKASGKLSELAIKDLGRDTTNGE
jgi:L-cystine transport system substrate-binding protein